MERVRWELEHPKTGWNYRGTGTAWSQPVCEQAQVSYWLAVWLRQLAPPFQASVALSAEWVNSEAVTMEKGWEWDTRGLAAQPFLPGTSTQEWDPAL